MTENCEDFDSNYTGNISDLDLSVDTQPTPPPEFEEDRAKAAASTAAPPIEGSPAEEQAAGGATAQLPQPPAMLEVPTVPRLPRHMYTINTIEYSEEMRRCGKCREMVNVSATHHEFLAHHIKRKAMRCPACEYSDVVVEFFECHIYVEHPELRNYPIYGREMLCDVEEFVHVLRCQASACGFTTVSRASLDHHHSVHHGWTVAPDGRREEQRRDFKPTHEMQMSLSELVQLNKMQLAGWNEGIKRLSIHLSTLAPTGLYMAKHRGFRVGSVCLYQIDPTQQGIAVPPYGWPRVRAMMVDLRKKPYVVAYFLATEIDLVEGLYEMKSLFGDHDVTMLVSRPTYYWMYGASPPKPRLH